MKDEGEFSENRERESRFIYGIWNNADIDLSSNGKLSQFSLLTVEDFKLPKTLKIGLRQDSSMKL